MRIALFAALVGLACEGLGNPAPSEGRTPPVAVEGHAATIVTDARYVPFASLDTLLDGLPPELLSSRDPPGAPGDVALLVRVAAAWRARVVPAAVPFVTRIRLSSGASLERRWLGRGHEGPWFALFVVPASPEEVVTALGEPGARKAPAPW